jgi:hypothetical protein
MARPVTDRHRDLLPLVIPLARISGAEGGLLELAGVSGSHGDGQGVRDLDISCC